MGRGHGHGVEDAYGDTPTQFLTNLESLYCTDQTLLTASGLRCREFKIPERKKDHWIVVNDTTLRKKVPVT
ncbi:MAG: hypothetical protein HN353_10720 [Bdellovibrionales bacterium]|nr:hypothetical protein [Bdellovibrionales bacterium]MBT3524767.1 hypothetical protein [Bdellovibrionales bacterium]MBT7669271.1 hypothetical protein [Bdellovibrionales bacterium]MBT7767149.1 hypothetical protein [Bdellovibrionales bacterium]